MTETKSQKSQKGTVKSSKKVYKNISEGRLYVKTTFNNTIVSVTDSKGEVLCWSSSGNVGFKGARRSTPFAATTAIEKVLEEAKRHGIKHLSVYVKGPGSGRDALLRYLRAKRDFEINVLADITPIPHNGPKPPATRKV